jgi:Raf kinase inhibitor-like YbhB/YbcL family protein
MLFAFTLGLPTVWAQGNQFRVRSTTFPNGGALPLSMVFDQCQYFAGGGNESPELTWSNVPIETVSFVVIAYDKTASFTHWGMYNIASIYTGLPRGAGIPFSPWGTQVANVYGDLSYGGPCPPPRPPRSHTYVFTVYALDIVLPTLPRYRSFPPGSEALYHALIKAARENHILRQASISGHFP